MSFAAAVALAPPISEALAERLRTPERPKLDPVPDFAWDQPYALSQAYAEVERWLDRGQIMRDGQRNELGHKFLARLHGLGVSETRARELFDYWIEVSHGDPPDDGDTKIDGIIYRIWHKKGGIEYNPPGSELPKRARDFANAADRLPEDRIWWPVDLQGRKPLEHWDAEKMIARTVSGFVALWFGKWGHHKTTYIFSKLFDVLDKNPDAKVLYLYGEGDDGMQARVIANAMHFKRGLGEYTGRFGMQAVPVARFDTVTNMLDIVAKEQDFKPDIVVIDTMANSIVGQDWDNTTAGQLTRNGSLGRIAFELGCTLILVSHQGKDAGRHLGAEMFYSNVDQVVYIKASHDEDAKAIKASSSPPQGKEKFGRPRTDYHAICYDYEAPVSDPINQDLYELLSGDPAAERSRIGTALTRLGAGNKDKAVSSGVLVRELYVLPAGMDPEEYDRLAVVLARAYDKAGKESENLAGLSELVGKQRLWFIG